MKTKFQQHCVIDVNMQIRNCFCSFNQLASTKRTIPQLKCQWNTMKISAKREKTQHKAEVFMTGGGPPPPNEAVPADDMRAWLPNEFIVDFNLFDSDKCLQETEPLGNSECIILCSASDDKNENLDKVEEKKDKKKPYISNRLQRRMELH